jgi:Predicted O-methyltransferase
MNTTFSEDRFLGGAVQVRQKQDGFRAGLDAVLLAAAIPAHPGEAALELGAGAGTATLCLAHRVGGLRAKGLEIDPELVEIASANAAANGFSDRVHFVAADVLSMPVCYKRPYDHVFCNPPFHDECGEAAPDPARARALQDKGKLSAWLSAGMKRTVSGGTFSVILRADRVGEALAALPDRGVSIFPLWPKAGIAAKRAILQVRQGSRAPLQMLAGLVLHLADGAYTPEAEAILRGGSGFSL